jgi:hypothetical protein
MFNALAQQFNSDPAKQQISQKEMTDLKERAYARDVIQKESKAKEAAMTSPLPQTLEKPQNTQTPPAKAETTSKSLADRLHDVKEKVSHEVGKMSEKVGAKASTVAKEIKTAGKDAFKQVETQVRNSAKNVEISATRLANNMKEGKLDVNQLKTDLGKAKEAHQFTAEDAKTLGKKLSGKAIEQLGSKGNEVTSKLGKDINTGINTGSIASPVAKRAADIIKDSLAHPSHQISSPRNDPSHSHQPAVKGPYVRPGSDHGGGGRG